MQQFTTSDIYELGFNDKPLELSIDIGFAQISLTNLYLGDSLFAGNVQNSVSDLVLGTNHDFRNKGIRELVANTIVHDIQQNTNKTSYKFRLGGGPRILNMPTMKYTVKEHGGVVIYTTRILFY